MPEKLHSLEVRRRRAVFRAGHRGTKELDLILGRFAEAHVMGMGDDQLSTLEEFLELPDPEIEKWVVHGAADTPGGAVGTLVRHMRQFHQLDGS